MKHFLNSNISFFTIFLVLLLLLVGVLGTADSLKASRATTLSGQAGAAEGEILNDDNSGNSSSKNPFSLVFDFDPAAYTALEKSFFAGEEIEGKQSFTDTLYVVIDYAIKFGGLVAFVWFSWAAFLYIVNSGSGDLSKLQESKSMMFSAILGAILLLLSFVLLNEINPALTQLRFGSA